MARAVLYLAVIGAVINGAVSVITLLYNEPEYTWLLDYNKVTNPLLVLLGAFLLLDQARKKQIFVNSFIVVLVAMPLAGSLIGWVKDGTPRFFVAHLFSALFILVLYWSMYTVRWDLRWLDNFLSRASLAIVVSHFLELAAFWTIVLIGHAIVYLGVSTNFLLLPFAYYLANRKKLGAVITAVLVVSSGKRSIILSVLIVLLLYFVLGRSKRLVLRLELAAVCLAALMLASFILEPYINWMEAPGGLNLVLAKWYLMNPFRADFDLQIGSAGRSAELQFAYNRFNEESSHWISGLGYGWSFFHWGITGSGTRFYFAHYVHFSPANFLFQYGLPIALLFFVLLWKVISGAYRWAISQYPRHTAPYSLVLYVLAALISALFGYDYAVNPFIWLMLGIASSISTHDALDPRLASPSRTAVPLRKHLGRRGHGEQGRASLP